MVDKKLAEYRKKAEANRMTKRVSFNRKTEKEMLAFANSVDFSQWVKDKIRETLQQ